MVVVRTSNQCPQPSRLWWPTFTESLKASAAHPAGAASHRAHRAAGWRSLSPAPAWTVACMKAWPFYGPDLLPLSYVTKILIRRVSLWQQLIRICWFWDETRTRVHASQRVVSSVGDLKLIRLLFLKSCFREQTLVLVPVSIWCWL